MARVFGLGYAPDGWTAACDSPALRGIQPQLLESAGVARRRQDGSLYDYFRNRIIFPIHGLSGDIVAFGARTIGDDPAKYINSPETLVYRKGSQLYNLHRARRAFRDAGRAVLVEGYLDAIRLDAAGITEVVATCGTALTPQQAKILARYTARVVIAYDGDAAGSRAAERAAGLPLGTGLDVGLVAVPDGLDPDGFVQAHGGEPFRELLDAAQDLIDFCLRDASASRPLDVEARVTYSDKLMSVIRDIPHAVRQELYRRKLAARLDVSERQLARLARESAPASAPEAAAETPPVRPPIRERDRELLRYALGHMARLSELNGLDGAIADAAPEVQRIVRRLIAAQPAYASEHDFLAATEDPEEKRVLTGVLLETTEAPKRYRPEWLVQHLDLRTLKKRIREAKAELRAAEAQQDRERVAALMTEVQALLAETARKRQTLHEAVEVEP